MKKLAIAAIIASTLITGCSSMGNQAVLDRNNQAAFNVGKTTKQDVYDKYGQPDDVFMFLGKKTWRYMHVKTSPEPTMLVLGALIWPLLPFQQTNYDINQTDFLFDENGNLIDSSTRSGSQTRSILVVGDMTGDKQKEAENRVKEEMLSINKPHDPKKQSFAYLAI